ncbi:uncharacterized protein LOC136072559 [Hydra vulgaris]|uniref:uncharacterized protein LOC136072559 n=1 Tax=Hydra vulgaris TaxID=6087 RepID=UPI0032EA4A00
MKLWNERLYVNEDFSDFTMDLRRKLFKEAKELRAKGFETILLERQTNKRGGGVLIYVKEHIAHNIRNDMCVSDGDKEIVTIEILNNKKNNILLSCCYRSPDGASENLSFFLQQNIIHKGSKENKITFIIGDFNMNCLIYNKDKKIKSFYDEILMAGAVPLINRLTRITKTSTTLIDNIFTTDIYNRKLKKGIIKTDISDHFPIFLTIHTVSSNNPERQNIIKKRVFNESNIKSFQYQLSLLHWKHINFNEDANTIYNKFFDTLFSIYDANFPLCEKITKIKTLNSPWITKGLKKSSKIKQKLYIKYLKTKSNENQQKYKNYQHLFEKIRKKFKKKIIIQI